jgi:dolichyl-phosphate-mannose--protein O-mannosyl transferase
MLMSLLLIPLAYAAIEMDPTQITCNSSLKFTHVQTGFHLTSSEINWGSGSGQQSVTATSTPGDSTSLWMIAEPDQKDICTAGTAMVCNSVIRLTHLLTGKNLHSHEFKSPLTGQQEVSAFGTDGQGDGGDDWRVVCASGKQEWVSGVPFHLQHVPTGRYLSASDQARFTQQNCPNCPIVGQLEVAAVTGQKEGGKWVVQRGVFIKAD